MRNKTLYFLYYCALMIILALYSNMESSPNTVFRFGYLAALVLPLINKAELFPAIIICALGISYNSYACMIMPTGIVYYVALALAFTLLALFRKKTLPKAHPVFYVALLYVAFNDLALQGELSQMSIVFFIILLLFNCVEGEELGIKIMPLAFIFISLAISYWALFCPDAQINSYNEVDEMEQTAWSDPNYLSGALGIGLVLASKELINAKKRPLYKLFLIITAIGASLALVVLASRGAIVSSVVTIVALILVSKKKIGTKILALVLVALFIIILKNNQYLDFIIARFENDDGSGSFRTEIWQSKWEEFFSVESPTRWFFGLGQTEAMQLGTYMGDSKFNISTHNDFLSMLLYYGFTGLFLFLYVVAYPLMTCQIERRAQTFVLLLFFAMSAFTIEPIAHGNYVYFGFLFYIIMYSRQGKEECVEKKRR